MSTPTDSLWLIWSNEHRAWWGPDSFGYTRSRKSAGVYKYAAACEIVGNANIARQDADAPHEAMILATPQPAKA